MRKQLATMVVALGFAAAAGCGESELDDIDDHAANAMIYEGQAVLDLFGTTGVTDAFRIDGGFRRVGVMWDAALGGGIEIRTSADGAIWSDWSAPAIVASED